MTLSSLRMITGLARSHVVMLNDIREVLFDVFCLTRVVVVLFHKINLTVKLK